MGLHTQAPSDGHLGSLYLVSFLSFPVFDKTEKKWVCLFFKCSGLKTTYIQSVQRVVYGELEAVVSHYEQDASGLLGRLEWVLLGTHHIQCADRCTSRNRTPAWPCSQPPTWHVGSSSHDDDSTCGWQTGRPSGGWRQGCSPGHLPKPGLWVSIF